MRKTNDNQNRIPSKLFYQILKQFNAKFAGTGYSKNDQRKIKNPEEILFAGINPLIYLVK